MIRPEVPSFHWITFAGSVPYEALNSLGFCLGAGRMALQTVSLLQDPGTSDATVQTRSRFEALLKMHAVAAPVQVVECDLKSPADFAQTLTALLASLGKSGAKVIIDLSATLPSPIPALAAQIAAGKPEVRLMVLQSGLAAFRASPLPLIPRSALQLLTLRDGMPESGDMPDHAPAYPAVDSTRQTWHLEARHLMLLINALLDLGYDRNLAIRLPLLKDLPLCRIHLLPDQVILADFIKQKDYRKRQRQLPRSLPPRARRQIPEYNQLMQLFYAAGALHPAGLDRLIEELRSIGSRPLDRGGDVVHIALDTNLLRDRFFSTCLSGLGLSPNVDFVLCETVRAELLNRQEKISDQLLDELAPLGRDLVGDLFFNQNQLEDRLRYIGLLEFNRMKAATGCHEQDSASATSSARNDRYILDAYSSFVDVGCKVFFLSRDQETIRMMHGEEGVLTLLLEHREMPSGPLAVAWTVFPHLIYLLAVACGRLEWLVGGTAVAAVDGVWRGKSVTQWEQDQLRVKLIAPRNSNDLEDFHAMRGSIQHDHDLLQQLGTR